MDPPNDYIHLSYVQVGIAAALILVNSVISVALRLGMERFLLLAAARTVGQLLLIGFVLQWVFEIDRWYVVLALMTVMTTIAGTAAVRRVDSRYPGIWLDAVVSIWASSWLITAVAVFGVLQGVTPWYQPRYTIPLLGMILGNALTGVSLGLGRLGEEFLTRRDRIETLLALGATRWEAARESVSRAIRTGMVPVINSMMVVGIVSLPGMMTGQLISGIDPSEAVKYQIVIMFLIASATGLGTVGVALLGYWRLFNGRHQFLFHLLKERE